MALNFSTDLKNKLLGGTGANDLKTLIDDGYIKVYSGAVPATADAALGAAVLLVTYSDAGAVEGAGNGLDMDTEPSAGAISKAPAQVWQGDAVAGGVATFFRYIDAGTDSGNSAIDEVRIQGTVGGAGADMFVQSTTFVSLTTYTVDYFSVAIPDA